MNRIRILSRPLLLAALVAAAPAQAQDAAQPAPLEVVAPATPNADRLAEQMRILAADPRNLDALLTAGELSAKLDDPAAAFAFFYRAEEVDPTNPRIAAGRARVLVRTERPGEALSLFAQAERGGMPPVAFAADRGFAYDLLGAPMLAQIDYRMALASNPTDDETMRRYALSLGITGQVDQAMQVLDPLLRRNDRAAWRARAFVLAMNGDVDTAEQIASNMLPGNMGLGLRPFFRRLENMTPSERAFAVHFGELKASPQRLADARLAPPFPSAAPPAVVSAAPSTVPSRRRSRREHEEEKKPPTSVAAAVVVRPIAQPLPPPPSPPPQALVQPIPQPASHPVTAPGAQPVPTREPPGVGNEDARIASGRADTPPAPNREPAAKPVPAKPAASKVDAAKPETRKADPKKAEAKKPELKKPEPKKPDPKKAEPARIWVQVAGGADEAALPGTWRRLLKAAPAAFKGRAPWTTPLRATNRLLTGPFKTADEAQNFVNALKKEGLSAFVFTSEAGQKITKLTVK